MRMASVLKGEQYRKNFMYDNNFLGKNNFIWFNGVVEDAGNTETWRLRVRCVGIHTDNKDELPTSDLHGRNSFILLLHLAYLAWFFSRFYCRGNLGLWVL